MASALAPSESEVITRLIVLRKYRDTLSGPAQILLDSLVVTGLGRPAYQAPEDGIKRLWSAYDSSPFSKRDSLEVRPKTLSGQAKYRTRYKM